MIHPSGIISPLLKAMRALPKATLRARMHAYARTMLGMVSVESLEPIWCECLPEYQTVPCTTTQHSTAQHSAAQHSTTRETAAAQKHQDKQTNSRARFVRIGATQPTFDVAMSRMIAGFESVAGIPTGNQAQQINSRASGLYNTQRQCLKTQWIY
jgi:hypothetical protein